ncbi:hypothetical protein BB559_003812 [Furculomyces boomerangus]|uniref:Glycosyl transferase 64 domain-containing protein n=1 Tax=Furculomyces boomerangus TaxID=61424 RepID=A0A2T9YIR4_9FUNG|nr:hypothetical protein BB559_003812 [Furculomyces boomerangus]
MKYYKTPCLVCPDEFSNWDLNTQDVKVVILNNSGKETPQMESWSSFNPLILKTSSEKNILGFDLFDKKEDFNKLRNFIYYSLFDKLIYSYENEYFLIVEDDVLLTDIEQLKRDVGCVLATKTDVFSLFNSGTSHFVYTGGTQAILYKRSFMIGFQKYLMKHLSFGTIDMLLSTHHLTCKTSKEYILHKKAKNISDKEKD